MSVVILDLPEGMPDAIVAEVIEAVSHLDEGEAELVVDIVASRVVEAIAEGLLEVRR